MTPCYDALIIGGGPAGAAAALLLARAGWSVLVIERQTFPRRKVCGEFLSATNGPLLQALGLDTAFGDLAGPPVRRVGLMVGECTLEADLPQPSDRRHPWGRALGREHLDTWLLAEARRAGAEVLQPWTVRELYRDGKHFCCRAEAGLESMAVESLVVIAAHGSWDAGKLPTQPPRTAPGPDDLFGFKAHYRDAGLPSGLMPLLAFPGGYGGMVHTDGGRVSLSLCIRREVLKKLRQGSDAGAGEAVANYLAEQCGCVRRALAGASLDGPWLATGPIRPGIRIRAEAGLFQVGNCAGEAHPVVAEGISMALQSAWLLAERLVAWRKASRPYADLLSVGQDYAQNWRHSFAPRIRAAALVAHWAMRPAAVKPSVPLIRLFPGLLTLGARLTGKASLIVH